MQQRMPEEMMESVPMSETPKEEPRKRRGRHLRVVTMEDTAADMTEHAVPEKRQAPPPLPEEALRSKKAGPTLVEEAEARMAKEKREMGVAKALGREAQAIREAQAKLAHVAVDELVAEQEAEEQAAKGFQGEEWKPPAKKKSLLDRIVGFFRS